ncbi:V(D)J recombination-activating protein 2 [Pseudophryne corroboree]|uniref:V(D)J recombination-activating protein 2 n=1 Tax=Pseudophryne corroboree TaxID=495146 RepID=UPI00308168FD
MTLQTIEPLSNTSLIQPGFSLFRFGSHVIFFGQKGWPKRSCPTGVFLVDLKKNEMKLRPTTFTNDSCYLPPLRYPAVTGLSDTMGGEVNQYLVHGGKTPNNEISQKLYIMSMASSVNKRTLCCVEKDLVGDIPEARYGHSMNVVHSRGKTAVVLFGGRCYVSLNQRTTEKWNSVIDSQPYIYLIDLQFGCSNMYTIKEIQDGLSFHVSISKNDTVYVMGGHSIENDFRSPNIYKIKVELLLGSPAITCTVLQSNISFSSAIVTHTCPDEFLIVGGYESDSQKRMLCNRVSISNDTIDIQNLETPDWTGEIKHSKTWFGADMGQGAILIGIPGDNKNHNSESSYFFYVLNLGGEESQMQSCSQGSLEEQEDSMPLEDSEELMFNEDGNFFDEDTYNEDDEEDESVTGYWIMCCVGCNLDMNTWVPYYSTELNKPAMIYCSSEAGHWVHAQCMDLSESMLIYLSENNVKYFCNDHVKLERGLQTPKKMTPVMKPSTKRVGRKSSVSRMSPAKKSFLRRLFE